MKKSAIAAAFFAALAFGSASAAQSNPALWNSGQWANAGLVGLVVAGAVYAQKRWDWVGKMNFSWPVEEPVEYLSYTTNFKTCRNPDILEDVFRVRHYAACPDGYVAEVDHTAEQ